MRNEKRRHALMGVKEKCSAVVMKLRVDGACLI